MTSYEIEDGPKMLKETLSVAQAALNFFYAKNYPELEAERERHSNRLQRLIDECDEHRPVGPDGKHGDRHTDTCGCDRS